MTTMHACNQGSGPHHRNVAWPPSWRSLAIMLAVAMCFHTTDSRLTRAQDSADEDFLRNYTRIDKEISALDAGREFVKADRLMQRLVDTTRRSAGADSGLYASTLLRQLARFYDVRAQNDKVVLVSKELLPLLEKHDEKIFVDMRPHALSYTIDALVANQPADVTAARSLLDTLEAVAADAKPGDPAFTALVRGRGSVARATGDKDLFIASRRALVENRRAKTGSKSVESITSTMFLATSLAQKHDEESLAEAKRLTDEVAAEMPRLSQIRWSEVVQCQRHLASMFLRNREFERAKAPVEAIVASTLQFDPEPGLVAYDAAVISEGLMADLNMLAIECRDAKQYSLAIPLFRFIVAKRLEKQAEKSAEILRARSGLGRTLLLAGEKQEGFAMVKAVHETAAKSLPPESPLMPSVELAWAIGLEIDGQHEDAMAAYEKATALMMRQQTAQEGITFWKQLMATAFAEALELTGKNAEAEALRKQLSEDK